MFQMYLRVTDEKTKMQVGPRGSSRHNAELMERLQKTSVALSIPDDGEWGRASVPPADDWKLRLNVTKDAVVQLRITDTQTELAQLFQNATLVHAQPVSPDELSNLFAAADLPSSGSLVGSFAATQIISSWGGASSSSTAPQCGRGLRGLKSALRTQNRAVSAANLSGGTHMLDRAIGAVRLGGGGVSHRGIEKRTHNRERARGGRAFLVSPRLASLAEDEAAARDGDGRLTRLLEGVRLGR